ncbi:hypothetical protein LWHH1689_0646 [Limosilactobacillus reuteri]|uniref:Uncharacterized protein n=1 Tax=Limosilactobacillus reuteri TaxID=1598 RepID=A0A2S1EPT5_LIMRT|nr:hypothetical protein LWHH1689_0646 [Limosilactobacillus reuteri]
MKQHQEQNYSNYSRFIHPFKNLTNINFNKLYHKKLYALLILQ